MSGNTGKRQLATLERAERRLWQVMIEDLPALAERNSYFRNDPQLTHEQYELIEALENIVRGAQQLAKRILVAELDRRASQARKDRP